MLASMGLLALVVMWIVWRRILKAPVLFFLAVLRILPFSGSPDKKAMETLSSTTKIVEVINTKLVEVTISSVESVSSGTGAVETMATIKDAVIDIANEEL